MTWDRYPYVENELTFYLTWDRCRKWPETDIPNPNSSKGTRIYSSGEMGRWNHPEQFGQESVWRRAWYEYYRCPNRVGAQMEWSNGPEWHLRQDIITGLFEGLWPDKPSPPSRNQAKGVPGPVVGWMAGFLTNRTQRVKIGTELSDSKILCGGVPQGTLTGQKTSWSILMTLRRHALCL